MHKILLFLAVVLFAACANDNKPVSAPPANTVDTSEQTFPYTWDTVTYTRYLGHPTKDDSIDSITVVYNEEYIRVTLHPGATTDFPGVWLTPYTFKRDNGDIVKVSENWIIWMATTNGPDHMSQWFTK